MDKTPPLLFTGSDWNFDDLARVYEAIREIAVDELRLDFYPNQIEVISSEQMLDAYSSIGMPLMYQHWSFGKHFLHEANLYRRGRLGLAYELVINSNPCITYLMEENTMALQTLVIAHASFGHNHFFKNNYLFQQWTDAGAILAYMEFAKSYIARCEERHGPAAVEAVLDAAHALMPQAVFRYRRRPRLSVEREQARIRERLEHEERTFSDLWRTLPQAPERAQRGREPDPSERQQAIEYPEENLLYFLEKYSPVLKSWQREILRIVRVHRAVFLPAAADQGDERRLRHLRPLHDHEPPLRQGDDRRGPDAGSAAEPLQRGVPARLRRSTLQRPQPLHARLQHDARHPAHLYRSDRRGP